MWCSSSPAIELEINGDDPHHIRFTGADSASHEKSGSPACRISLDAEQWGRPVSWSTDGRRLVLEFARGENSLTLWKIADQVRPTPAPTEDTR